MVKLIDSEYVLLEQIKIKRIHLMKEALERELTDQYVVRLSQELDQLVFIYQSKQYCSYIMHTSQNN
ncbi:aspartyl-phosphate phosphatase Spo0E family protein [Pseudoneobacillus sp. C159]